MKSTSVLLAVTLAFVTAVAGCSGGNPIGSTAGTETAVTTAVAEVSWVTLKIYPQRLNLNSEGVLEPVTAVLGGLVLPTGYNLTAWDLGLYFDGVFVASADLVTYYFDDLTPPVFYVSFDRAAIREYCLATEILGGVPVQVSGWLQAAGEGDPFDATVTGFDYIEVVKQGNKEIP